MNGDLEPGQPCFRELEQVRADGKANCSIPSVPASKLNLPEGWSVPRPTPWKGSGAEGASSASAAPTGSKDGSILWKAIYFSDLADIVAYFMRARARSVARARPSLRHLCEGVGVVDRARKARCACFVPKSHINKYGYERTTVTLWRHSWTLLEGSSSYACT